MFTMTVRYALKCTTDVLRYKFFSGEHAPGPPSQVSNYNMCPGRCLTVYHMYVRRYTCSNQWWLRRLNHIIFIKRIVKPLSVAFLYQTYSSEERKPFQAARVRIHVFILAATIKKVLQRNKRKMQRHQIIVFQ